MPTLSEADKQKRRLAIGSVIGTHAMEGIELDATVHSIMERFAAGEIDLAQFSAEMQRHAQTVGSAAPLIGAA
jgi:hypothetical protein